MLKMRFLKVLIIMTFVSVSYQKKSFDNHKVVTFRIQNEEQLKEIQSLESEPGFTFLDPPEFVNMKLDLVIQPGLFPLFEEIATANQIDFKIATNDLQSLINGEKPQKNRKAGFALDRYNSLAEMYEFLDEMVQRYPSKASIFNVGESFEGRMIKGMKIVTSENNPAIFIEANIHAREWISSATATWIINEILTTTDANIRSIVDSVTWYIVPVVNVDGFQYTHDENRLWRKTRSIHNLLCRGVDPNRNFPYNFRGGGSSKVACSDTYSGPTAYSEKETKALMDFYATIANKVEVYLCFHSAARLLMYPFGNTLSTELVPNAADLHQIAGAAVAALQAVNGTVYDYGNAMDTLYVTSGSSRDHAYGFFKTPIVFTYEMREGKENIFILDPQEIYPNSLEVFASVIQIIIEGKSLGYFELKN